VLASRWRHAPVQVPRLPADRRAAIADADPDETIRETAPKPPHAHTCYRLAYDDALAPTRTKKPAPCTGVHTGVTFFVGHYDKSLPVDGTDVHQIEATACPRRFAAFVGGTPDDRRLSMLRTVWFTPTVKEAARGAHWFEWIDEFRQIPDRTSFTMARRLDRTVGRDHHALCGTAEPGTAAFEQRICAAPHIWVALRTVYFKPGLSGRRRRALGRPAAVPERWRRRVQRPLNYAGPTGGRLSSGGAGRTYGVCWAPS
jgi:hypothetical protein